MPKQNSAEYLGSVIHAKADPNIEIHRRIAAARFVFEKLELFWKDGLLPKRERILIYDALVSAKLTYGLHMLPLKDDQLQKLDAFHLKGLRRIL